MSDVEKLKAELEAEKARADKAEASAQEFKEKADKATQDFAESAQKQKRTEIAGFVDQGIKDGTMLPSWKDAGIVDFMMALEGQEETYEFSEGKKESAAQWFKDFITSFSEHPLFKEMVKPKDDKSAEDADFAEEEAIARDIAASTGVTFDD